MIRDPLTKKQKQEFLKTWIIDLESFTVEARTRESAVKKAEEIIKKEGAKIDRVIKDTE